MSAPTKLRAGTSELTKLKVLWRDTLSESTQAYWRSLFVSADSTQAQIRRELQAKLKIKLDYDSQLNSFRDWVAQQDAMNQEAEDAAEFERRILAEHPDWTKDQVRAELIKRFYQRALATGDADLGLRTIVQDLNVQKVELDSRKLALLEKKAAAYDRAQAALAEAKQSKGGITPETMSKIEAELKLL